MVENINRVLCKRCHQDEEREREREEKGGRQSESLVFGVPIAAGFTPAGIAAGSLAAAWQSSIGNVVVGSTFAALQSMGATGTLATGAYSGAGVMGLGAVGKFFSGNTTSADQENNTDGNDDKNDKNEEEDDNNKDDYDNDTVNSLPRCARCGVVRVPVNFEEQRAQ